MFMLTVHLASHTPTSASVLAQGHCAAAYAYWQDWCTTDAASRAAEAARFGRPITWPLAIHLADPRGRARELALQRGARARQRRGARRGLWDQRRRGAARGGCEQGVAAVHAALGRVEEAQERGPRRGAEAPGQSRARGECVRMRRGGVQGRGRARGSARPTSSRATVAGSAIRGQVCQKRASLPEGGKSARRG